MGELLLGTTLLASFLGGMVALLAPCCVSVMLPAYLATGFRHRGGVVAATCTFGAGVATVILPIGLGATVLSRLLIEQHVWLFSVGGALMIATGFAVLAGWKPNLPMPGARGARESSYASAYALGAFSGLASACCAPVLIGVAILSGAAASFPVALAIGLTYVAGMVAPLALIALVWDRRRERATQLITDRTVRLRLGRWRRELALGTLLGGLLMIGMGVLALVLAVTGPGMPSGGWQTEVSAWLQHLASVTVSALSWLPGWALALALALGIALLTRHALRTRAATTTENPATSKPEAASISATFEENPHE
ncbi:cytochrome C biogenesis protein [Mycolicibacterium grossiae]|uniref:Cytochrome C biogenesis protein n=1 Tax=Mycolicibacterium grossiae TaxID=1552759 RepID=A0A1E8PXU3_9MYCO|nr:cytochrome c biogenesis protein CcdA [Mycolicibacterium grossiae]OFJ51123.1 cytochrome C biogenesis protein [Mycolicibacterium grossiae]